MINGVDNDFVSKLRNDILNNFDNKLMIPSDIKIIDQIPKLGTGKKDYKMAKQLAL